MGASNLERIFEESIGFQSVVTSLAIWMDLVTTDVGTPVGEWLLAPCGKAE